VKKNSKDSKDRRNKKKQDKKGLQLFFDDIGEDINLDELPLETPEEGTVDEQ
jgi:hypothetical protein